MFQVTFGVKGDRIISNILPKVWKLFNRSMSDSVTVSTVQGDLRGKISKTNAGKTVCSFKGVPYAKPPIGTLRFMAPQPPASWSGVRDALVEGNVCPHKDPFLQDVLGEEDCLFLNVYSPKVPTSATEPLKPVMVWIHGGGFHVGHGNSDMYGPDFLVNEDVVLVTFNYRLGVLGFLSLQDAGVSGNAGLKDQVAVLRWVKQNVGKFGGDPNNVTIFGESSGGACVQYHLLSPMSKGLFHRAISQSGSALSWWGFAKTSSAVDRAFSLGKLLGLSTNNPSELLEFLKKQSAAELVKHMRGTSTKENKVRGDLYPFVPTIEIAIENAEEVFLPDNPLNLLKAGRVHDVPFLIGVNSQEGIFMLREVLFDPSLWPSIDKEFQQRNIPLDMNVQPNSALGQDVALRIKSFYFKDAPVSYETRVEYASFITDIWFGLGVDSSVKYHAAASSAPVYYYQLSFDGEFNWYKKLMNIEDLPGTCHSDDLGYLFTNAMIDQDAEPNSPEMKTVKRMCGMWANFARTGDPTPELNSLLPVKWEPTLSSSTIYLDIDNELVMKQDREKERMQFWEKLYEEVGTIHDIRKSKL